MPESVVPSAAGGMLLNALHLFFQNATAKPICQWELCATCAPVSATARKEPQELDAISACNPI